MAERTINQRQRDVLAWIADGCPADRWADGDTTYKTTAVALKGRRLITISKKKGAWSAQVTDAGRHFVEHDAYPEGHWAVVEPPKTVQKVRARAIGKRGTGLRPVDQLMFDLQQAGGTLIVEDPERYYDNLAASATRHNKVPHNRLIEVARGPERGQQTVRLVDKPDWMTKVLTPVPVPATLGRPHPAIATLRADKEQHLRFKSPVRSRALVLLNTLAKEATRRGYTVTPPKPRRGYYDHGDSWDLRIGIGEHHSDIKVSEDTDKIPHKPTAKELRDAESGWGRRIPKYDHIPSGRLLFTVEGWAVRQAKFGDTKTLNLNDRLAEVLQEVELRAERDEQNCIAKEKERAERQAHWESVRAQAVVTYREQYKADTLAARATRCHQHIELGEYLAALTAKVATLTGPEREAADQWLTWAQAHFQASDPLDRELTAPDVPEPGAEQLKPYMKGLDPCGPRGW